MIQLKQYKQFQMIFSRRINAFIIIVGTIILMSCSESIEIVYYDDGNVHVEIPIVDGKRNGKAIEYSKEGSVIAYAEWKNGLLNGKSVVYFNNGKISQENHFKDGIRCCNSNFYLEDGSLREVHTLDNEGSLIDYIKYNKDGSQDLDIETRNPIYISKSDTIIFGNKFSLKMRVGNREYNSVEGIIGNPNDKYILYGKKLQKSDSITVLYETKDYGVGKMKLKEYWLI